MLAVPSGCSEEQRRAAIHACNMAGLSVLYVVLDRVDRDVHLYGYRCVYLIDVCHTCIPTVPTIIHTHTPFPPRHKNTHTSGVIREPMAALLAYRQQQQELAMQQQQQQPEEEEEDGGNKRKIMVVFDLGHVHLDVGVVEEDGNVRIRCVDLYAV